MRELSFAGFLTAYVRDLSPSGSGKITVLMSEAAETAPRLREPLLLYAVMTGKQELLCRAAEKHGLTGFYGSALHLSPLEVERSLEQNSLPEGYQKVWNSYKSRKNRYSADSMTKDMMRSRVLALREKKRITNYRIYTDLGLNPGNLNAWLKHGDGRLVSLDTARAVLRYTEDSAARKTAEN